MKTISLITGSLIAFFAVSLFALNSNTKVVEAPACQPKKEHIEIVDCFDIESIIGNTQLKNERLFYSVTRKNFISISKDEFTNAQYINEIVPNYPGNWIDEYKEVAIIFTHNGIEERITGPDNKITSAQHEKLQTMQVDDNILIEVDYRTRNVITDKLEASGMKVSIGVKPATEAYYPDGYEALISYLTKNSEGKIRALKLPEVPTAVVEFTVNEKGKVTDPKLVLPSQNEKVDQLLLQLIENMPNWKPATDANGNAVSQKFEFRIGVDMC